MNCKQSSNVDAIFLRPSFSLERKKKIGARKAADTLENRSRGKDEGWPLIHS